MATLLKLDHDVIFEFNDAMMSSVVPSNIRVLTVDCLTIAIVFSESSGLLQQIHDVLDFSSPRGGFSTAVRRSIIQNIDPKTATPEAGILMEALFGFVNASILGPLLPSIRPSGLITTIMPFISVAPSQTAGQCRVLRKCLAVFGVMCEHSEHLFDHLRQLDLFDILSQRTRDEVRSIKEQTPVDLTNPTQTLNDSVFAHKLTLLNALLKALSPYLTGLTNNSLETHPILEVLQVIFGSPRIFGSVTLAWAVNVFAGILHNEPSSFTILSKHKIVDMFLAVATSNELADDVCFVFVLYNFLFYISFFFKKKI